MAHEGLLTSVSITVSNIETTTSGLLGIFLLSDPGPAIRQTKPGWTVVSTARRHRKLREARINTGQTEHTVERTLRAPPSGQHLLYGAIHHGTEDGSEALFFGASAVPASVEVRRYPRTFHASARL